MASMKITGYSWRFLLVVANPELRRFGCRDPCGTRCRRRSSVVTSRCDLLNRLAPGEAVGDRDPIILGQKPRTDRSLDEAHPASVDEPHRSAAQRHTHFLSGRRSRQASPDQLEIAALDRRRHLVVRVSRHPNPLDSGFATFTRNRQVYPVIFIDAIVVKVRDGQVRNKPIYVVIGVTVNGERDILGLWAGDGAEGAKFWLQILTELKNRGVTDVCIAVCDGLKGLPDAINTVWEFTTVQACIIHLIRNTFRYASRKYWDQIARDLRPVYTAATEADAKARFAEFTEKWGRLYPAITKLWQNAWSEFVPFLDNDVEIRRVICSTNAIESLNARYRRAVRVRGHFPNEQAAMKCLYLTTRSLDPTGNGRARWATRWKPALNAFAVTFEGRIPTK